MSSPTYDEGGYLELDNVKTVSQDNNKPYTALNVPNSGQSERVLPPRTGSSRYDDVLVHGRTETSNTSRRDSTRWSKVIIAIVITLLLANMAAVCYLLYRVETAPVPNQAGQTQEVSNGEETSNSEDNDDVVVAFYARTGEHSGPVDEHEVIQFDDVTVNIGDGYNCECGKFQAPVAGIYSFGYEAMASSNCGDGQRLCVSLFKDDEIVSVSCTVYGSSAGTAVTLDLDEDSSVWVAIHHDAPCHTIHGGTGYFNKFSGHLVSRKTDS